MGKAIIDEDTLIGIADAIRTKKGTTNLIPTPNMRNEILSISGGGSPVLENGFTVNFHDESGSVVEIHSAKNGMFIGKPLYYEKYDFKDSNGDMVTFPFTSDTSATYMMYLQETTFCDEAIYSFYGISKTEYPYLLLDAVVSGGYVRVVFTNSFSEISNGINIKNCLYSPDIFYQELSVLGLCQAIINNQVKTLNSASLWGDLTADSSKYYCTNFETVIANGRLDTTAYEGSVV